MVAPNRQDRPTDADRPAAGAPCPFCPGSGKVPEDYTVLSYDNDFPALTPDAPVPAGKSAGEPYRVSPAHGKCEVLLYSPDHEASLSTMSPGHIRRLIDLWAERTRALARDPKIKYVFLFENKGAEVGVTLHHPHGQLYAYPFIPLKIQAELGNCRLHRAKNTRCLLCDMNAEEMESGERVILQDEHFVCYLPYFTDYPFGAFVVPRRHLLMVTDLSPDERASLARMLKDLTAAFDRLFDQPFPYMMCVHQGPVNEPGFADAADYYHLHLEFYPPLRDATKIKYYASSEMGAWAACNPLAVEGTAALLRQACRGLERE